jgi:hypothetical protein
VTSRCTARITHGKPGWTKDYSPAAGYRFGFNAWNGVHAETVALRNLSIQTVPEPGVLAMLPAAGLALVGLRRFRQRLKRNHDTAASLVA